MGAELGFIKIKAKRSELKDKADNLRDNARFDHGHSGYTGTIAEDNGKLDILSTPMNSDDAYDYVNDNAEKWDATIAIPVLDEEDSFFLGGIYSC